MPDDVSTGELARRVADLVAELREVNQQLRSLSTVYVPRGEHELAIGGLKVDVARVEETAKSAQTAVDELDEKLNSRFRAAVWGVIVALLFPIISGVVLYALLGS